MKFESRLKKVEVLTDKQLREKYPAPEGVKKLAKKSYEQNQYKPDLIRVEIVRFFKRIKYIINLKSNMR